MKSQASIEFMALVSILLMLFILYTKNSFSLQKDMVSFGMDQGAKRLSDRIAFEISTAVKSGDGYKRNFFIEKSFSGVTEFSISVENYEVKLSWNQDFVTSQTIAKNTTGNFKKGWNLIENRDGVIYVS